MEKLQIEHATNPDTGLHDSEVNQALKNEIESTTTKSYKSIFLEHTFTFFNILNFILAALVIYTGSWRNMLFMVTVICNMVIGLIQEIRSKRVLDKLALIHQQKSLVLREGKEIRIPMDQIAMGDILILESGDQIPTDGVLVSGMVQVNESMLTGESDNVDKDPGDSLYSGCFVTAGKCKMQVVRVGHETYMYSVLQEARRSKRYPSQLRDALQTIIKYCTIFLVPAGILLFIRGFFISGYGLNESILSMTASMIGMIPEGLVILTSIALAVSSVKLARKEVLVQELYCIETLARVDVLCLDKTGTITQGTMRVAGMDLQPDVNSHEMLQILSNYYGSSDDDNVTAKAIREYVHVVHPNAKSDQVFPFSSSAKCSGVTFGDTTYLIGAYSFMFETEDPEITKKIQSYASKGIRVLAVAKAKKLETLEKGNYELLGLILIEDVIRPNAAKILEYFREQDVTIKIISGDMPETVAAIAKEAGVSGEFIDMGKFAEDPAHHSPEALQEVMQKYTIFGRVTPEQKRDMVKALKSSGHTVAMTGDGVNDVMALKEADCSIAMGSGTQAARSIASLVLLEDQFAALPSILMEGRRVINNVQRTSSLFLVKTIFSFGISLLTIFWLSIYPFEPIQLTLVSSLGVGIPAFFLTLEPNYDRVTGNFLANVFGRAIPGGICVISTVIVTKLFAGLLQADQEALSTICTILAGINSFVVLFVVCNPLTKLRKVLLGTMILLFAGAILLIPGVFSMTRLTFIQLVFVIAVSAFIPIYLGWLRSLNWPHLLERIHMSSTSA